MNAKTLKNTNDRAIVLVDLETSTESAANVKGGQSNTTGGGNPSIWAKIKSVAFGVDASFF